LNLKENIDVNVAPDVLLAREPLEIEKLKLIEEMTATVVQVLDEKKGQDVEVLRVAEKTTLADVFVVASGTSSTHVKTLADAVEEKLKEVYGLYPGHVEGLEKRNWVLLDYGDMIVHVMLPEDRMHYQLESLWRPGSGREIL
jgi:ribosome-associated protein